ncbi:hypothetical protein BGZ63DRAFT_467294 [Mariannaea sp. PMI_226]|nr:hypothetical protein BGZ63DRAFT_467294 [Mariannaea sp. PMI_226]
MYWLEFSLNTPNHPSNRTPSPTQLSRLMEKKQGLMLLRTGAGSTHLWNGTMMGKSLIPEPLPPYYRAAPQPCTSPLKLGCYCYRRKLQLELSITWGVSMQVKNDDGKKWSLSKTQDETLVKRDKEPRIHASPHLRRVSPRLASSRLTLSASHGPGLGYELSRSVQPLPMVYPSDVDSASANEDSYRKSNVDLCADAMQSRDLYQHSSNSKRQHTLAIPQIVHVTLEVSICNGKSYSYTTSFSHRSSPGNVCRHLLR